MPKISCKAILFDMDESLGRLDARSVARVFGPRCGAAAPGFDPDEAVHRAHGRPSISTIRELLPDADHEAENREVERREILDVDGVDPLARRPRTPGLSPCGALDDRHVMHEAARRRPYSTRLASAAPSRMITAHDIARGKPDPEPYLKGAALLGFAPQDCVVIEDASAGVRSGKAAGARVIALQTTETNDDLIALGADWIVKDCGFARFRERRLSQAKDQSSTLTIEVTLSGIQPLQK